MTDIQLAAEEFIKAGFDLVRIKKGEKEPSGQWRNAKPQPTDFQDGDQIALKATPRRVCIDVDCPEAAKLLPHFIKRTDAWVEGRAGKPDSHWWVNTTEDTTLRHYNDIDTKGLLDIVGVGGYAVVPPSTNTKDGHVEVRKWVGPRPAFDTMKPVDPLAFRYLGVATILARHWPTGPGLRNHLAGAVAGLLLRCQVAPSDVKHIIEQALHVAGDDQILMRMKMVADTISNFKAGKRVTGGPKVAEALGDKVKSRICGFLDAADFALLDELSQRWFICDVGADTVVGEEVEETNEEKTRKWTRFAFRSFTSFRERLVKLPEVCIGERQNGNPIMESAANYWLRHEESPQYDRLVYAPIGSGVECNTDKQPPDLNGWKGFTVAPQQGDWSKTKAFILDVVCNGDTQLYEWFLDWCAALMQRPGEHADTTPVFTGPQGTGKNFVMDKVIGWCFDGRHAATVVNLNGVLGDFNDKLSGLVLLTLDEVQLSERESVAMRGLVTGDTLDINRKHIARSSERNMLHIAILSNDDAPVKIANDDRRFAFFPVSAAHKQDHPYFAAIAHELDHAGGRAAMLHDLLARKYDRNRLRNAPVTSGKKLAKAASLTEQQNALRHWLHKDEHVGVLEVSKERLFDTLRGSAHRSDEAGWTNDSLGILVNRIWPKVGIIWKRVGTEKKRHYQFGLVADARAQFDTFCGIETDWPTTKMDDLVVLLGRETDSEIRKMGTQQQIQNTALGLIRFGTTLLRKLGVDVADLEQADERLSPPVDDSAPPF